MKTVLCDIDCVVADLLGPWLAAYNAEYAQDVRVEDVSSWDLGACVPHGDEVYQIIRRPGFFASLPLLGGAKEGLEELLAKGNDVYLVSAAYSASAFAEKFDWVRKHLPFMNDRVFLTDGKTPKGLIRGDVLIDDGPHNLIDFKERNPNGDGYRRVTIITRSRRTGSGISLSTSSSDTRTAWKTIVEVSSRRASDSQRVSGDHRAHCPSRRTARRIAAYASSASALPARLARLPI
jgi:5'(3')-deoxyribonucleotidase